MRKLAFGLIAISTLLMPVSRAATTNPFVGRWDFNLTNPTGTRAMWLGVTEKDGNPEIWYQPSGGNVYQVKDFKLNGSHLSVTVSPGPPPTTWELDANGDKLTGEQKRGENSTALTAVRAPE